eukprot:CAMPEP_0206259130 /NCGR_PEP_ID=MMETSP0047_2-20121206/26308_1 /ASSEMBLY_ACC=CAM_ASM_000192 /TAXON_ID=195065 /ORGANISM="Chroomonas mesostigmatica_cf, Strain CCMP1168" /LENGTH=49 /DNA_ID= /DNA_START= /DNA_END= /DNA_ORIENTATION=
MSSQEDETIKDHDLRMEQRHHYMRPTKSMEQHFANGDQDVVKQAFLPTS